MKCVLVEVELHEGPGETHPETLRRALVCVALDAGAKVLQSKVFDVRDAHKPDGAS